MKVAVLTLGCKANQSESFLIESGLLSRGYEIVDLKENPDYCIINTCSVTARSDYQSRQLIRRASRAGSRVIVTGCYSQLNREDVLEMGVDKVVSIDSKLNIINMLPLLNSCNTLERRKASKSRFFIKVQDGCNYCCSYCIIPKARGRSRSIPLEDVIRQIHLASCEYGEIVLTGIHLGTYGCDLIPKVSLSFLLGNILLKTRVRRIRLSSLEIRDVDRELLEIIRDPRVCKHLHIPLQSGDDKILRLMKRGYTTSEFQKGINLILREIPSISIGTDIIAGFPGEGESEFENTLKFLDILPLSYFHVFPYSRREGTDACEMPNPVDSAIKKERCSRLRALGSRKKEEYMRSQVGKTLDVLIEKRECGDRYLGTTGNYLKVSTYSKGLQLRDIVPVRIAGIKDGLLSGYPIRNG